MKIVRTLSEIQSASLAIRKSDKKYGFVPTMGYLHEGHLSLVRKAREQNDELGVSIYVNPTQFCPGEDFEQYPRNEERDFQLLEKENVDWVFVPTSAEIYAEGYSTYIEPPRQSQGWCGDSRPGHFRGVCTIISILLNVVQPTHLYVGQKDAQQAAVIGQMIRDLRFPTELTVCPTVREPDGLAMSSRNSYLSQDERRDALILYNTLMDGLECYLGGEHDTKVIRRKGEEKISSNTSVKLDYLGIVDQETFQSVEVVQNGNLYIGSIYVGNTRLIDNITFIS